MAEADVAEEIGPALDLVPPSETSCRRRGGDNAWGCDWSPVLLPRVMAIHLGYMVGASSYYKPTGMQTMLFVLLSILVNEFASVMLRFSRMRAGLSRFSFVDMNVRNPYTHSPPPGTSLWDDEFTERLYGLFEHASVLWRYFSITAMTYALNEMLKKLLNDGDELVQIAFMMTVIFVISEAIETVTLMGNKVRAKIS